MRYSIKVAEVCNKVEGNKDNKGRISQADKKLSDLVSDLLGVLSYPLLKFGTQMQYATGKFFLRRQSDIVFKYYLL